MKSSPWHGEESAVGHQPLLSAIATDWERHGVAPALSEVPAAKPPTAQAHASTETPLTLPPHETLLAAAFAISEAAELLLVPVSLPDATAAHLTGGDCRLLPALSSTAMTAVAEAPPQKGAAVYQKLLEALATLANGGLPRQAASLEFALFGDSISDRAARRAAADEQQDGSVTNRDAIYSALLQDVETYIEHSGCNLVGSRRAWRLYSLAEVTYCRQASKLLTGADISQDRNPSADRALACLKLIEQLTATATVIDSAGTAKHRAASAADDAAGAATRRVGMESVAQLADTYCGCEAAERSAEVVGELLLDSREFAEDFMPALHGNSTLQCSITTLPAQPSVSDVRDVSVSNGVPAVTDTAVRAVNPAEQSCDSHSSSSLAGNLISEELHRRLLPSVFLPAVKLAWCCYLETIVPMPGQRSDVHPPCALAVASRLLDRASTTAALAAAPTAVPRARFAEATTRAAMLDAVRGLLSAQQQVTT